MIKKGAFEINSDISSDNLDAIKWHDDSTVPPKDWIGNKVAVKNDAGKPDFSHISYELMEAVARVREFGAKKYARNNWKLGFKYTRSIAACLRHIFAFLRGEDNDPESGLSHIAHAICNLEHLLYDISHRKENDDR